MKMKKVTLLCLLFACLMLFGCTKQTEQPEVPGNTPTAEADNGTKATSVPKVTATPTEASAPTETPAPVETAAPTATSTPTPSPSPSPTNTPTLLPKDKNTLAESLTSIGFEGGIATGFITNKEIVIYTDYVEYHIGKNVYVPADIIEVTDATCKAMEELTGLSFKNQKYSRDRVKVVVEKNNLTPSGYSRSEAYAGSYASYEEVVIMPADLFLGNSDTFIHEMAHVLEDVYDKNKYAGMVLTEGFSTYVAYMTCQKLWKENPDLAIRFEQSLQAFINMSMNQDEFLVKPLEYWIKTGATEISANGLYSVGFRLMFCLNEKYGNFTDWLFRLEEMYDENNPYIDDADEEISLIQKTYGDEVIDVFYAWLKENRNFFERSYYEDYDITKAGKVDVYPYYNRVANETCIALTKSTICHYEDLYINLIPYRFYMENYKKENLENLSLNVRKETEVVLYNEAGEEIKTVSNEKQIPLDGVFGILLKGTGDTSIEILGYDQYTYEDGKEIIPFSDDDDSIDSVDSLFGKAQSMKPAEYTITENLEVTDYLMVYSYVKLKIAEGKKLTVVNGIGLGGTLECGKDTIEFKPGSWMWLEQGSYFKYDDVSIMVILNDDFTGTPIPYGEAIRIIRNNNRFYFNMGYKVKVYITVPEGADYNKYINIGDLRRGTEIYVNDKLVIVSDDNDGLD